MKKNHTNPKADSMESVWAARVRTRASEREAYLFLPTPQKDITFGDHFVITGEPLTVGRVATLTELLISTEKKLTLDREDVDFLMAAGLYDSNLGWFPADVHTTSDTTTGVVHVSMLTPISPELYGALRAVDWDESRLSDADYALLTKFIRDDNLATQRWIEDSEGP